ncbi:hypothetical protein LX36DRAFT_310579 [Colletotrichum falcatum]|nr:hypothetical protein LX36DRAFT_310579 [Colletotrichum falcatum]
MSSLTLSLSHTPTNTHTHTHTHTPPLHPPSLSLCQGVFRVGEDEDEVELAVTRRARTANRRAHRRVLRPPLVGQQLERPGPSSDSSRRPRSLISPTACTDCRSCRTRVADVV